MRARRLIVRGIDRLSGRRGLALLLVLVFIVLFTAMLGVASRQTASALRIETVRIGQLDRDAGSMQALSMGVALLETGTPPSDPFACVVTLNTAVGLRTFTVTYTADEDQQWIVHAAPSVEGETAAPMPSVFTPLTPTP